MRITIAMPACNAGLYIREAIESVQAQTHQDFRLAVFENGSSDDTRAVVAGCCRGDSRIRLEHSAEPLGSAAAHQAALEMSDTDWVVMLDADDVMLPDCLETQLEMHRRHPKARLIAGRVVYINSRGEIVGYPKHLALSTEELADRARHCELPSILLHTGGLLHKPTVLAVGGYRSKFRSLGDDDDLVFSIANAKHELLTHDRLLVKYRLHTTGLASSHGAQRVMASNWVAACLRARWLGEEEPDREAFFELQRRRPFLDRLRDFRRWAGRQLFRQASLLRSERRIVRGSLLLAVAMLLAPRAVFSLLRGEP